MKFRGVLTTGDDGFFDFVDLEGVFKSPQARESSINFLRGWEVAGNDDVDG